MEQMNVPDDLKMPIDYDNPGWPEPVRTFRPLVYSEGEQICVVLGPDTQTGIVGTGMSVEEALQAWSKNLRDRIEYHKEDDELARYIVDTKRASVKKVG